MACMPTTQEQLSAMAMTANTDANTRWHHQCADPAPRSRGFYHCISRCVRRAWLCGVDPYNGTSYEHRRDWVEQRLLELAEIYAVGLYAYAVMSNHVHVVLHIAPDAAAIWTDRDVAARWVRLLPATTNGAIDPAACRMKKQALLGMPNVCQSAVSACPACPGSCAASMNPSPAARTRRMPARAASGRGDTSARPCSMTRRC